MISLFNRNIIVSLATLFLVIIVTFPAVTKEYTAKVLSNHDGDTLTVTINGKKEKVRLLGVDTAEMAQGHWGQEAKKFTNNLTKGKTVRLETDIQERDKYGRLLAYAYVDGKMINQLLIQEGYAQLLTYSPNVKYVEQFKAAQAKARNAGKGIWGVNGLKESPYEFRHGGKKTTGINTSANKSGKTNQPEVKVEPSNQSQDLVHVNSKSGVYHSHGCRFYNCSNCTIELTEAAAKAKGYKRCKAE